MIQPALRLCALLAMLAAGLSLPVPPKLMALKSHHLSTDTIGRQLENELLEIFDSGLLSPSQCEDYCSLTYPTHTYPVVENHLACKQGCILMQTGTQQNTCTSECTVLYSTKDKQYACSVGCNTTVNTKRTKQSPAAQTLVTVVTTKTSGLQVSLFHLKENLKHLFWNSKEPNIDSSFQWDQPQQIKLGKGRELFVLSGHLESQGDLTVNDVLSQNWSSMLPRQVLTSFSHPSLIYMSKSVLVRVQTHTFVGALMVGCVFFLLVGVPVMLLSSILESKARREVDSEKKTTVVSFKLPPSASFPYPVSKDNIGSEFIPKESPISPPVAILFE